MIASIDDYTVAGLLGVNTVQTTTSVPEILSSGCSFSELLLKMQYNPVEFAHVIFDLGEHFVLCVPC